jgi:REP element-mobilizing transposase RayT
MSPHSTVRAKYQYRRRLPHLQKGDAVLFVTYCTNYGILPGSARDLVLEHWLREGGIRLCGAGAPAREAVPSTPPGRRREPVSPRIHLLALVVMPDHVHGLLTPLRDREGWPFPLVDILQCAKSATAHHINRLLHRAGPVWEEESFDHILRSDESLEEKYEYIRENPVKAGLVEQAEDYQWLWVEAGLRPQE